MPSLRHWFSESIIVRIVAGLALAAAILFAIGWLIKSPFKEYPAALDSSVRYALRQTQSPMWTALYLTVTKLGSTLYLSIVGCIAGLGFIVVRWFRPVLLLIIVMAGQAVLHHGFKWLFARPRPSALISYRTAEGSSFPSGHAIGAVCLYLAIAWIISVRLENPAAKFGIWIFAILLVFLIGMSRAYIGVHYPTDVVAGFLAGAVWTAAVMSSDRSEL